MGAVPGEAHGEVGDRIDQVLAVVQNQQGDPVGQRLREDVLHAPRRLLGDTRRFGHRSRNRCRVGECAELDEPRSIGEAIQDIEGRLDGEPCLADAAQSHNSDHALSREQRHKRLPLLGTPHEAGPYVRQIVNDDPDQPQRRELGSKIRMSQLEQPLGLRESAQLKRPQRNQAGVRRQPALGGVGSRLGDQDLAAMCPGADAGHLMNGEIDVAAPERCGRTGVDPDPHQHLDAGWPGMGCQRSLALKAGGQRFGGVGEREEERVTLGVDLHAAVAGEGAAKQRLMGGQQPRVALADLAEEAGGALDVGHDEGDQTRGQLDGDVSRPPRAPFEPLAATRPGPPSTTSPVRPNRAPPRCETAAFDQNGSAPTSRLALTVQLRARRAARHLGSIQ